MAHEKEEDVEVEVFPLGFNKFGKRDEFVHFLISTIIFISSPIINQAPPREKPLNQKRPPAVALIVCLILKNDDEEIMTKVATLASNTVSASAW